MSLSHAEFIRRFAQHILPKRFVRIRHYGFLSSTWKRLKFTQLPDYFKLTPKSTEPPHRRSTKNRTHALPMFGAARAVAKEI